jgi:hypothetical protein
MTLRGDSEGGPTSKQRHGTLVESGHSLPRLFMISLYFPDTAELPRCFRRSHYFRITSLSGAMQNRWLAGWLPTVPSANRIRVRHRDGSCFG